MVKKVNFLIGTLSTGGAERVVSNLSLHIDSKFETEILLFGENALIEYPYAGKLTHIDKINHNKNIWLKLYALYKRISFFKKMKKENPETTYVSFLEYPNIINILSKSKEKTIISVRNHMSTKHSKGFKNYLWRLTIKYLYNKADVIVAVSQEIKKDLVSNYKIEEKKIKVVYNSYDIELIKNKSQESLDIEWEHLFQKPVVLTAGRLDRQKGQWHLIRSFSKVREKFPEASLVILGKGKIEKQLKELVEEMNLSDVIHFIGFQSNPFKYIARASVFVLPSLHEGFPNALAEAMACGAPVISTDCLSGPREILAPTESETKISEIEYGFNEHRYGILIPTFKTENFNDVILSKEEEIMAEEIARLLEDERLRDILSNKSVERVRQFDINQVVSEWEELF